MKKPKIIRIFLTPVLESIGVIGAFLFAYYLRGITDGIPFVQLRIPYISYEQFLPFIISGVLLWIVVFGVKWLYTIREGTPIFEEIRLVLTYSFFWFFLYISFVYLTTGFLFQKEIPRLIIIYVYILSTIFSLIIRLLERYIYGALYKKWHLQKNKILVVYDEKHQVKLDESIFSEYLYTPLKDIETIRNLIRTRDIDTIISVCRENSWKIITEIINLSRIYGIGFVYPKLLPWIQEFTKRDGLVGDMPVVEILSVSMSEWERISKRTLDIIFSFGGLILLSPIFLIIAIGIKLEDHSGPVIFRNRRIGKDGKIFELYKFRYMYWKYSVKDAYGVDQENDEALIYEEKLKSKNDTRNGPLYKIQNDPRKMRFGKLIERLSLDELPQLWNVLRWDMSLIGPRPHQPREVEQYRETDHQVLTVKPGITGMAQVYGRDKNSWEEEVIRDRYYIEHYSITLDLAILIRTIFVVISRIFKK